MFCVFSRNTLPRRERVAEVIEISAIDLRYESYRMKNPVLEGRLLASIAERGIEEPLEGVEAGEAKVLLNGFKRYRCARKLKIKMVPYTALGEDEASAMVQVLRASNRRTLSILEQARFIDHLHAVHKLEISDIADLVSRSKSWVTMRLGLIGKMSERVRENLFGGRFPVYSYMYTLRPFMRMNGEGRKEVEEFIEAVGGKRFSVRQIEQLAHGYFRGPESFREEVRAGNFTLVLEQMNGVPEDPDGVNEFERVLLKDLELVVKYMQRVVTKYNDRRLKTRSFYSQANLLAAGVLSRAAAFSKAVEALYDRSADA
jgi:hypothetical protein